MPCETDDTGICSLLSILFVDRPNLIRHKNKKANIDTVVHVRSEREEDRVAYFVSWDISWQRSAVDPFSLPSSEGSLVHGATATSLNTMH